MTNFSCFDQFQLRPFIFPRGNPRALAGFFLKTNFLGMGLFKLPNSSRKVFNCHSFRSLRGRRLKGMWKGVLGARGTRGSARGGREVNAFPSSLLPRAWSRALIPFPSFSKACQAGYSFRSFGFWQKFMKDVIFCSCSNSWAFIPK